MFQLIKDLFDPSGFPARWECGHWSEFHGWVHIISDLTIFLAYILIPIHILFLLKKKQNLPFPWLFLLFALFILFCGVVHAIEAVIFFYPVYRFSALIKIFTAIISVATTLVLMPTLPKIVGLKTQAELEKTVEERTKALKYVELALRQKTKELSQMNRELEEFAFAASHDLRAPLRKIKSFGDLIEEELGKQISANSKDYLERIKKSIIQMENLISSLLDYSKVGTDKTLYTEKVDLNYLCALIKEDFSSLLEKTQGTLEWGLLPIVDGNKNELIQLFQNLVENAIKYRKEEVPPYIKIYQKADSSTPLEPSFYEIVVEDNGLGFEEQYSEKIFKIFERLDTRQNGTGIGLAICKKIVKRHRGSIFASSVPKKGSSFHIRFPRPHQTENS